jgi:DNA-binding transcriptional LysR family regulator
MHKLEESFFDREYYGKRRRRVQYFHLVIYPGLPRQIIPRHEKHYCKAVKMETCEGLLEFLTTAQTGSFTRAARELGVSVAHISRQISALEARLGTQLIIRTTRRVSPTVAGEDLALRCRPLMEELARVQDNFRLASETIEGNIRISGGHYVEQKIVPMLGDFCARYPQVRIEVDLSNRMADLFDGNFDFAVWPAPLEDSAVLVARPLPEVRMVTMASPALVRQLEAECGGAPLAPASVPASRCLGWSRRVWRFRRHGQSQVIEPAGAIASNSAQALIRAAAAGIGVIRVPEYYLEAACNFYQLVPVFQEWKSEDALVCNIVYVRNRLMPSRVRLLIDYLLSSAGEGATERASAKAAAA